MRIISRKTLIRFWQNNPDSEQSLKAWFEEAKFAQWNNPNELKRQFGSASILNKKRVVFNIKANNYRLVADIEYRLKIVFIIWVGTHKEYDKLNIEEIKYVKTN